MIIPQSILILSLATAAFSIPTALKLDRNNTPPGNATFFQCTEDSTHPICRLIRPPALDVTTTRTYSNGTKEIIRNQHTRKQLKAIRNQNNVTSIKYKPGEVIHSRSAEIFGNLTKRESAPRICHHDTMTWFDQINWGFWFQPWRQVGSCFYCVECTEGITWNFAVTQTWTVGLDIKFSDIISASFGFSFGESFSISDTRTCLWHNNIKHECHSIWYQPLMSYHNGYANYMAHTQCPPSQGKGASESYSDHHLAQVNVNQAVHNGVNQGNLGCNSGCQGSDHRQCLNANAGGVLWPPAN